MTFYYIKNIQGDVTAIAIADSGKLALTISYDAWGNPEYSIVVDDNAGVWEKLAAFLRAAGIMGLNNYTYRGYFYDLEIGLYYLQSRYYDPEVGRFINLDETSIAVATAGEILATNLFAYCCNNPVNFLDNNGFYACKVTDLSLSGLVNSAAKLSTTNSNQKGKIKITYFKQYYYDGRKNTYYTYANKKLNSFAYSYSGRYLALKYVSTIGSYYYENAILYTLTVSQWYRYFVNRYSSKIAKCEDAIYKYLKKSFKVTDKQIDSWRRFINDVKDCISFSGIENPLLNQLCFASDVLSFTIGVLDYIFTHWITKRDKYIYNSILHYVENKQYNYNIMILFGIDNYHFTGGRWVYEKTTYPY